MTEMKVLVLIAAAALNPLVVRTNEPVGMVPANCEVSGGAPVTRVAEVEQQPDEVAPLPTVRPAATVKKTNEIQELQRALAKNDRATFDAALARAREQGAQTRVYEDIARLWDAQFEYPFFAEGSEPHRIASSYRGYEEAVRKQVFTDARGRKFYPAAESKAFVAKQVGVSAPSSSSSSSTRRASAEPSRASSTPRKTTKPTTSTTKSSQSKSRPPVARRTGSAPEASHPIPSARPARPATTAPAPVVTPAANTSAAAAPPGAGSSPSPSTATTAATETTAPVTEAETAVAPDTAVSDTTPTTATVSETTPAATSSAPATAPSKGRSIILPAIMILIGLGVLILLFRTAK